MRNDRPDAKRSITGHKLVPSPPSEYTSVRVTASAHLPIGHRFESRDVRQLSTNLRSTCSSNPTEVRRRALSFSWSIVGENPVSSSPQSLIEQLLDMVVPSLECAQHKEAVALAKPGPARDDWSRRRAPRRPNDVVLQSDTHVWLRSIPTPSHPKQLCLHHPHLANRLAKAWGDAGLVQKFMDDVLIDKRGHRKGLSERVRMELQRLERLHVTRVHTAAKLFRVRLLPASTKSS